MPRQLHLSASAITAFKACPTRFKLAYVDGIRRIEDTEAQRQGTNWHAMHEVYRDASNKNDPMRSGSATPVYDPFSAAIAHLNEAYQNIPDGVDANEWAAERAILAASFAGYCWYYQSDSVETIATEIGFDLPLHHPKTGLPLKTEDVIRVGKIDRLARVEGRVCVRDYKSTSKPIDADSQFWNHLRLDDQISMYCLAAKEMQAAGMLEQYGIGRDEEIAGAFYDVWHKPAIRPKMLTQADTRAFIESGEYMGAKFEVKAENQDAPCVWVDGAPAEVEPGKKGFAIRETPEMFGARLLADIYANPEKHFARREIPRTDADLEDFRHELYNIYQSMKSMRDSERWYKNGNQCEATFRCQYTPLCYGRVDVSGEQEIAGFRRIFTPLTVSV